VLSAWSVLAGRELHGENILVIGAGMVGLETADFLASKGKKVVVVEALDQIALAVTPTLRAMLLARLEAEQIRIITGVVLEHWGRDAALVRRKDGAELRLEAIDNVVIAVGSKPDRLSEGLHDKDIVWKRIGDSERPRDLLACISEAAEVAMAL